MMAGPLLAVFMLRDLSLTPFQYGFALGVPSVGGILGAFVSTRLVRRVGNSRSLLLAGALRAPWLLAIPFAPSGIAGLATVTVSQFALLFSAGVFNPIFSTARMELTPTHLLVRVGAAWSASSKTVQPAFIALGGLVATLATTETALAFAAAICLASSLFLPWHLWRDNSDAFTRLPVSLT